MRTWGATVRCVPPGCQLLHVSSSSSYAYVNGLTNISRSAGCTWRCDRTNLRCHKCLTRSTTTTRTDWASIGYRDIHHNEARKTTPLAEPTTQLLDIRSLNCCVILLACSAGHIKGSVVECIKLQAVCKSDHSTVVIVVAIASCLQATFHFVIVIPSWLNCWQHIRFTS